MRLLARIAAACLAASLAVQATTAFSYHVVGDEPGSWPRILSSVGLNEGVSGPVGVFVVRAASPLTRDEWLDRIDKGAFLILEGDTELAAAFGFVSQKQKVRVRGVQDALAPALPIIWEKSLDLPLHDLPKNARVFTWERWDRAPLVAGFRHGAGGVLWVAASPGANGYERFPYLPHALAELGFDPPVRSRRLWAFFDSSYRSRVDLDYFAEIWRKAGISALHVAAWHYFESDPQRDDFLRRLIDACHKRSILVYAWLELPHVSEKFWDDHPEWREKTALLQDALLDWRKLINLSNPAAAAAVGSGVDDLVSRFDWDGVNLAELYFESLEGYSNPARFTPLNDDVRREFHRLNGFDPIEVFDAASPKHPGKDAAPMRAFLEYRAALARRLQSDWIGRLEQSRHMKPWLDLVLTHVDDRFDATVRDAIGADASAVLPLLSRHDLTFLIEDPATVWNLGPDRYPKVAEQYAPLTTAHDKLAIDINVVERYQDVYPTKQQTGAELFQLVHMASGAFPRVALYFESSLAKQDLPLLPAAGAVTKIQRVGGTLEVDSLRGVGVAWKGSAAVDGKPWPALDGERVWLPAGRHIVAPSQMPVGLRLLDLSADLISALATKSGMEIVYRSSSRVYATLDRPAAAIEVDGQPLAVSVVAGNTISLPRGQHIVHIR